ncbi:unnamed protein product [Strongylus vulgaris]|uniref:Uncharacterized protein n=1 Tax=Strongylus vulgaris TaxID=40348 RepID=A0A3P7LIR9_STRVU|nr:unnamed protein product [Strongylus vulgaris]
MPHLEKASIKLVGRETVISGAAARANNTFVREVDPTPLRDFDAELVRSGNAVLGSPTFKQFSAPILVPASTDENEEVMDSEHVDPAPDTDTVEKIAISKKKNIEQQKEYDLSRRAQIDLERLISEIKAQESVDLIGEHPAAATIDLPRATISGARKSRPGYSNAKLISLSGTARVHDGEMTRKRSTAKLVQLKKKRSFGRVGATTRQASDFDPWERMGQRRSA